MATYLHDIASVQSKHDQLPAVLANIDLNRGVGAGDPVDRADLIHARSVALVLKGVKGDSGRKAGCPWLIR
jgi:hypothetical protein